MVEKVGGRCPNEAEEKTPQVFCLKSIDPRGKKKKKFLCTGAEQIFLSNKKGTMGNAATIFFDCIHTYCGGVQAERGGIVCVIVPVHLPCSPPVPAPLAPQARHTAFAFLCPEVGGGT